MGKGGNGIVDNGEPMSKFWIKSFHSAFIVVKLFKYFKLGGGTCTCATIGKHQRQMYIQFLVFPQNKLHNKLSSHFHLGVHIFAQIFLHWGRPFLIKLPSLNGRVIKCSIEALYDVVDGLPTQICSIILIEHSKNLVQHPIFL